MLARPQTTRTATGPLRVVIVGGGFAALELLLALRALAEERVAVTLLTPQRDFIYRPTATEEAFGATEVRRFDLAEIAAEQGAALRLDAVEAVAPRVRRIRTTSGANLDYDVLVLALGARRRVAVPGAITFRDQRDSPQVRRALESVAEGRLRTLAFTVPAGHHLVAARLRAGPVRRPPRRGARAQLPGRARDRREQAAGVARSERSGGEGDAGRS